MESEFEDEPIVPRAGGLFVVSCVTACWGWGRLGLPWNYRSAASPFVRPIESAYLRITVSSSLVGFGDAGTFDHGCHSDIRALLTASAAMCQYRVSSYSRSFPETCQPAYRLL